MVRIDVDSGMNGLVRQNHNVGHREMVVIVKLVTEGGEVGLIGKNNRPCKSCEKIHDKRRENTLLTIPNYPSFGYRVNRK